MKAFVFLSLVACANALSTDTSTASNFCNMNVCGTKKSIACSFTTSNNLLCEGAVIPLDQNAIVKQHNELRQKIASGGYAGYPTAAGMNEMKWNDDLAQMALYNAMQCKFGHDECRNTVVFTKSGQNIAMQSKYGYPWDYAAEVNGMIQSWFDEYQIADKSYIDKYYSSSKMVGHFTQIVKDNSKYIGCAAVFFKEDGWENLYLVCNYERTNILGEPTYVAGNTASRCSGTSGTYPALCTA